MPKVLLIAYFWPPLGGIGMLRATKFAKYLPEFGWATVVLAPEEGTHSILADGQDTDLTDVPVVRAPYRYHAGPLRRLGRGRQEGHAAVAAGSGRAAPRLYRRLAYWAHEVIDYPDPEAGWFKAATAAGLQAIRQHDIDVILSTSSPVTSHLIALELKRLTGKPWVADLRDLWTQNPYADHTKIRLWFERRLERRVLARADSLVTVSQPLAEELGALHERHRGQVRVVTNGFDEADFAALAPRQARSDRLVIVYTGSLYGDQRDVGPFLEALRTLEDRGEIRPGEIEVNAYGPDLSQLARRAADLGLEHAVHCLGNVPYKQALQYQVNAHALLLVERRDTAARGNLTGKVFEYLGARRPIIALASPDSTIADLLAETRTGVVCATAADVADVLRGWHKEWLATGDLAWQGTEESRQRFTRRALSQELADVFKQVVSRNVRH